MGYVFAGLAGDIGPGSRIICLAEKNISKEEDNRA